MHFQEMMDLIDKFGNSYKFADAVVEYMAEKNSITYYGIQDATSTSIIALLRNGDITLEIAQLLFYKLIGDYINSKDVSIKISHSHYISSDEKDTLMYGILLKLVHTNKFSEIRILSDISPLSKKIIMVHNI